MDSHPRRSPWEIFRVFLGIGLSGFGGALPWARRSLIERHCWLTDREFAELLGLCQVLPGGNTINLTVSVGARYGGAPGATAAFCGLLLTPFMIVSTLGVLYANFGQLEVVQRALRGVAAVAVGLLLSTGVRLTLPYRRQGWALALAALAFVGVGVLRLPLLPVVLVLAPFGIAIAARRER